MNRRQLSKRTTNNQPNKIKHRIEFGGVFSTVCQQQNVAVRLQCQSTSGRTEIKGGFKKLLFDTQGVGASFLNTWLPLFPPPISTTTCQNYTACGHLSRRRWLQFAGCKQVLLPAGVNRCMMACRWIFLTLCYLTSLRGDTPFYHIHNVHLHCMHTYW